MKKVNMPSRRRAVASLVAGLFVVAATFFTSAPAHADYDPVGGGSWDTTTVAAGGALTLTLTPSRNADTGFDTWTYFCEDLQPGDMSDRNQTGFSVSLVLVDENQTATGIPSAITGQSPPVYFTFSGPGLGNFAAAPENAAIDPLTLAFTIPSSLPPGNYTAFYGCVSPEFKSVSNLIGEPTEWIQTVPTEITVTAADKKLADTGLAQPLVWSVAGLAGLMLTLGLVIALWRRVRSHNG